MKSQIKVSINLCFLSTKSFIETAPSLLEGNVFLCGRDVLYLDEGDVQYPPSQFAFDSWGCIGRFDPQKVGK